MELDKIVIMIMALAFFGGLGYVAWNGRQERKNGQKSSPIVLDQAEGDSPNKSQHKNRKISKS